MKAIPIELMKWHSEGAEEDEQGQAHVVLTLSTVTTFVANVACVCAALFVTALAGSVLMRVLKL